MAEQSGFHDVRFPTDISIGSSGGPQRSTEIITLGSGREQRNQRWSQSRRRYDAGYGVKGLDLLQEVVAFYEARRGPLFGFRFRDPLDWKSCALSQTPGLNDVMIAKGDGVSTSFQLLKNYGEADAAYARTITKPVKDSVIIAVSGQLAVETVDYQVDYVTGLITFTSPVDADAAISAGFEFDVPVRFESDDFTVNLAAFTAGEVPSIPLIEVRT